MAGAQEYAKFKWDDPFLLDDLLTDDERMIQFLGRRAYRLEWLYSPATQLYPNRRWSALD